MLEWGNCIQKFHWWGSSVIYMVPNHVYSFTAALMHKSMENIFTSAARFGGFTSVACLDGFFSAAGLSGFVTSEDGVT